ncbi:hypothetical protein EYF80_043448 [Liparis tanakae]|uniref:Uncharacterized protein n=1 Tax=Liparis tanakae TaxID=230148 RepID=A0A4Z2FZP4_9TELE|nr:hypothetical protein EYF80_043448 [Liparis tanakae]
MEIVATESPTSGGDVEALTLKRSEGRSQGLDQGNRRRVKLVVDREHETSSTGEDSAPEPPRGRAPAGVSGHATANGSVYVAQNGSIIRTRRAVNTTGPPHAHTHPHTAAANNNLKPASPAFSSRLAKHFKKLDRMAATLEERVPLRTFQSSGATATSVSLGSTGGTGASGSDPLDAAPGGEEGGEREAEVDGGNDEDDDGGGDAAVAGEPLESPSDRTQSDEEELWMGPWNRLHIPMTKL